MKKLINDPKNVVRELFEGFHGMYSDKFILLEDANVVAKKEMDKRVALVIGGGSGHEPLFLELIGEGLADAVCQGNVFAAPSPDVILKATKAVDQGEGVLFVYGNYAGDNLNFDMAAELADMEGIKTTTIRVMDDVASAPKDRIEDRRGIAGDLFVIKVAGAACHAGLSLDEVTRITRKARDNVRTMGVAVSPGTIPGVDEPTFQLADDEMEIGMGLHGEPGVRRGKMRSADELVDELLDLIIEDLPFVENDEVCILVNGYGSTTRMELYICMRRVLQELDRRNVRVYDHELGNYATCQEMAGVSVSLMRLDEELKTYYSFPAWSPGFYKKS